MTESILVAILINFFNFALSCSFLFPNPYSEDKNRAEIAVVPHLVSAALDAYWVLQQDFKAPKSNCAIYYLYVGQRTFFLGKNSDRSKGTSVLEKFIPFLW